MNSTASPERFSDAPRAQGGADARLVAELMGTARLRRAVEGLNREGGLIVHVSEQKTEGLRRSVERRKAK